MHFSVRIQESSWEMEGMYYVFAKDPDEILAGIIS